MRKLLLLILLISSRSFGQTLEADRLSLVAFYNAGDGPNWGSNWVVPGTPGDSPCGWDGVTCEGGRVTGLVRRGMLTGMPLPVAVGSLTALKLLDLRGDGEEIPSIVGALPNELGNLINLEYLDLSGNPISGVNVGVIGNLTNLKHFEISPYYWQMPAEWSTLTNLEYLSVSLPDFYLSTGGQAGDIPSYFGNFTKLKTLKLRHSSWTGNIPASLGNLVNLEILEMPDNSLTGTIPASFNNLTKLTKLDLSGNQLTGPIPNILGIPVAADVNISRNAFNFSGMESNISLLDQYAPQALINAYLGGPLCLGCIATDLSVSTAGGTLANNTYRLYKNSVLILAQVGDDMLRLDGEGVYYAEVTSSAVPGLTLRTKTFISIKLPVTLVSFEGKSESNQTKLTWKTTSETNNKGFEIERSADAQTFGKIGFVDGSGDTRENQFYHFTDLNPLTTGYYRLKQLDYDGKFEYSKVIVVKAGKEAINIYPNPAQTEVTVEGPAENELVSVFTPTGRLVVAGTKLSGGKLDVKDLKEGIYTLKIGDVAKKLLIKR